MRHTCHRNMVSTEKVNIEARAYNIRALINVNKWYRKIFTNCCDIMHFFLPKMCHKNT